MKCEACGKPGVYREDYQATLCDTHAEVPSYASATPRKANQFTFWSVASDMITMLWVVPYALVMVLLEKVHVLPGYAAGPSLIKPRQR